MILVYCYKIKDGDQADCMIVRLMTKSSLINRVFDTTIVYISLTKKYSLIVPNIL